MTSINAQGSRLAVTRPSDTTAATAFTASVNTEVTRIVVCNTSGVASSFRLFHGASGDSYDEANALFWDHPVPANGTVDIYADSANSGISMQPDEILGVRSGNANALTFSVYGVTAVIAGVVR